MTDQRNFIERSEACAIVRRQADKDFFPIGVSVRNGRDGVSRLIPGSIGKRQRCGEDVGADPVLLVIDPDFGGLAGVPIIEASMLEA